MNLILADAGNTVLMLMLAAGPMMILYGVLQLVTEIRRAPKRKVAERLKGRRGPRVSSSAKGLSIEELRRTAPEAKGLLASLMARMSATERLQAILEQANLPWSAATLLGNLTLAALLVGGLVLVARLGPIVALGSAAAVFVLPILYLMWRRKRRLNKLVQQLPDVFELLSQALRAGHSLASGMQLVANEMPEPAGTEFGRVFHEQNLGLKIEDALKNLAERMDVLDIRLFVTAVLIQRQTGGDLAEVLDKIGGVIRERIKLHGTVQALTAEGRLSGYVLLALPVIVFVAMLKINPDYAMLLINHPTGQMMTTFAVVMMTMGYVMIKKIINIDV